MKSLKHYFNYVIIYGNSGRDLAYTKSEVKIQCLCVYRKKIGRLADRIAYIYRTLVKYTAEWGKVAVK